MKRKLLIVLFSAGAVLGFASGFAHLRGGHCDRDADRESAWHHDRAFHDHHRDAYRDRFAAPPDDIAERCAEAAVRAVEARRQAPVAPATSVAPVAPAAPGAAATPATPASPAPPANAASAASGSPDATTRDSLLE